MVSSCIYFFRVVPRGQSKDIGGHVFQGFQSHTNSYNCAYLTAAAAVGMTKEDVDLFIKRLDKVMAKVRKSQKRRGDINDSTTEETALNEGGATEEHAPVKIENDSEEE